MWGSRWLSLVLFNHIILALAATPLHSFWFLFFFLNNINNYCRFHLLSEFDNGKRSCRKRLADHNRRRRKCHQSASATHDTGKPTPSTTHIILSNLLYVWISLYYSILIWINANDDQSLRLIRVWNRRHRPRRFHWSVSGKGSSKRQRRPPRQRLHPQIQCFSQADSFTYHH